MKKVILLKGVTTSVRQKVLAEKHIQKQTDYLSLAKVIVKENPDYEGTVTELIRNIISYTKSFKDKGVSINSLPMQTFFLFCHALGYAPKLREIKDPFKVLISILEELKARDVISNELYISQRSIWNEKGENLQEYEYFACYYSKGFWEPGLALLKMGKKWDFAFLEFFDESSMHSGPVTKIENSMNVFIQLKDESSQFLSLISIKPVKNAPIEDVTRFNGSYSSALAIEDGKPVAGKLILIKKKTEKDVMDAVKDPKKREHFSELLNGRIKFESSILKVDQMKLYVGCYEAYWFLVFKNYSIEVRQIKLEVLQNGTCRFTDPNGKGFFGLVLQCDGNVLKIGIDPNEDGTNFRSQWIFDINHEDKGYFDGVYSGQRQGWRKIMGGKIRLYKSNKSYEELTSIKINMKNAQLELRERAQELESFFYGSDTNLASDNFIQPTLTTIRQAYGQEIDGEIENHNKVKIYKGFYTLYRLDSSTNRVNRYNLEITTDGTVHYSLLLNETIRYEGNVTSHDNCLFLHIKMKQDKLYNALYIFYVGPQKDHRFQSTGGVYTTVAADGSPICGRAVLQQNIKHLELKPVEINSEEYFDATEANKRILALLTGTENNFIKSRRQINSVRRKINYGNVFFSHACKGDLELSERIEYIKFAFKHGFVNIEQLNTELERNEHLRLLANAIHIREDSPPWFQVDIDYKDYDYWTFRGKRKELIK